MNSNFYLSRKLTDTNRTYTEAELLDASKYIVVLAEPGAGKTELMGSLAHQLGVAVLTANVFRYLELDTQSSPLVLDAFDELAKIDKSGIHCLLANARKAKPTHVIISSRSSEWDSAATNTYKDYIGRLPLVVKLCEFDEAEQRAIFEHHVHGENFSAFQTEVARFDLAPLLPNPQFLKLFANAYVESDRHFKDKKSIFSQAIERLAKETNINVARPNPMLSVEKKVAFSSEVFTKLLLSGVEGVNTCEAIPDRMYPLLESLFSGNVESRGILATQLFKPGDGTDLHRPIHKIVTEYCAADYLTKRVMDPGDHLNLSKCLPIIAPNSTVRDELRGLLGWMAALGNKPIEEAAIKLDPYAVLANGDPSQLEHSSKRLLIARLIETEANDPYFRRGDFWRRFSVAGFFTKEVVNEIKPLLAKGNDGHLRDLILELLAGTPAIEHLSSELRQLALDPNERPYMRLVAARYLLEIANYDCRDDLMILIGEASHASLNIVAEAIEKLGPETFDRIEIYNFLRVCENLYPGYKDRVERTIGERFFIKRFIETLGLVTVEWLLDELTKDLVCKCGKKSYECDCRNGISKIVGTIMDRYFELTSAPSDPERVWQWVRNLNFHGHKSAEQSKAVDVLQKDDALRQGIIGHVFGKLTDRDHIFEIRHNVFGWHSHSGLHFRPHDDKFVVDLAFETDNVDLWASFMATHQYYRKKEERGPDSLRRHMREQAATKLPFMREWAMSRNESVQSHREKQKWNRRSRRMVKRHRRVEDANRLAKIEFIQDNRELVEKGLHFDSLVDFACQLLWEPEKIELQFGDDALVRNALRNCLKFLAPSIPDLPELAELQCTSQIQYSEIVLYAACLEIMRFKGSLESVDIRLLKALRTNIHGGGSAVSKEERDTLKAEVDRLIFPDRASAEEFLRQYLEPQLASAKCVHPELWLLSGDDVFSHLRSALSVEWLRHYSELAVGPLDTLFEIAAQHGDLDALKAIITERCEHILSKWPVLTNEQDVEQKRTFWYLRSFYYLNDTNEKIWEWLKADKNTALLLYGRSSRMSGSDNSYWPKFTSRKVEAILDAFIDKWAKVDLPSHWGTSSPVEEKAYRFLTQVIWSISSDDPDNAIPVLDRLLSNPRFADLHRDMKSIRASQIRKKALMDFEPPTPREIVDLLDRGEIVTVEGLRELLICELSDFQKDIDGGEFNIANLFYEKGERRDEQRCTEIIAGRLRLILEPKGITVTPEHQLKNANRSDFTATKMLGGRRRLLVTEVKGQWHRDLYTAAAAQLYGRYSIHPDAEQQGVFLVVWFGEDEKVGGIKKHGIQSSQQLKARIEEQMPPDIRRSIDVFVLDVSRGK